MNVTLKYTRKTINVTPATFGAKLAKAMAEIQSSHVYFIMQQAYGEIDYLECEQIWKAVLTKTEKPITEERKKHGI